jgi:uncharacterized protein YqeY
MSLKELIKSKLTEAMKNNLECEKSILRVVLGEVSTLEGRNGSVTDEEIQKIIRKLCQSIGETAGLTLNETSKNVLLNEISYLEQFLPKVMSKEEILNAISHLDLKSCKSEGQATGMAIKELKKNNLTFSGEDVSTIVKELRG